MNASGTTRGKPGPGGNSSGSAPTPASRALINETIGQLRTAIPAFAEQNCENEEIANSGREGWTDRHQREGERAAEKTEAQEAERKLKTLSEEMDQELEAFNAKMEAPDISGKKIHNHRRVWDWERWAYPARWE